jgi:hypothetical protein
LAPVRFAHFCFAVAKAAAKHVFTAESGDPFILGCGVSGFDVAPHSACNGAGRVGCRGFRRIGAVG